ncbi:hypothetical protein PIGHUM_03464 [Pigmentiphaga humi]|uniref:Lipoprotein n=1 Tax=Pigmentiphaga humi TaxID=2478468 RepID=A0A3P4B640_9BURK|nr:hypothetical protein [Pigmentiphaga humi]VCU71381.1 hypothetical protein PIGHUM_03464 [Pigmentiphaga humi]
MKPVTRLLAAIMIALAMGNAAYAARAGKPMQLHLDNPIRTLNTATPGKTEIENAIIRAGMQRNWIITRNGDGTLNAHLAIRQHTLDVTIVLKDTTYDIVYKNSTNLQYAPNPDDPARPIIHPSYDKWVDNLIGDIRVQLAQL